MPIEDNTSLERPANSRAWDILRVGAIVVPWLCAVIPPVILLTGFYASVGRLLFFDFVMMPFANVVYLALSLGGQATLCWIAFLFFPALSALRLWRSRSSAGGAAARSGSYGQDISHLWRSPHCLRRCSYFCCRR